MNPRVLPQGPNGTQGQDDKNSARHHAHGAADPQEAAKNSTGAYRIDVG